jgi:hypothetical protein
MGFLMGLPFSWHILLLECSKRVTILLANYLWANAKKKMVQWTLDVRHCEQILLKIS